MSNQGTQSLSSSSFHEALNTLFALHKIIDTKPILVHFEHVHLT